MPETVHINAAPIPDTAPTLALAPEPGSAPTLKEHPLTEVIAPAGQSVVSDGKHGTDRAFEAALISDAGHQRTSAQIALDGRFDGQANLTTMLALKDSEARTSDRFARLESLTLSEHHRTRELFQAETVAALRANVLRLELGAKA